MFKISELRKIMGIIDQFSRTDDEDAMEIRSKCNDLVIIKEAWKSDQHVKLALEDN